MDAGTQRPDFLIHAEFRIPILGRPHGEWLLQQLLKLLDGQSRISQDIPQGSRSQVLSAVNRNGCLAPTFQVLHRHVAANLVEEDEPGSIERLECLLA